jgi:hypothetical protein
MLSECGSVNASSCVNGAAIRHIPLGSSPKSRCERAILQKIEQEGVHVCTYRLHRIERERIAVSLIRMHTAHLRIAALCD